MLVCLFTFFLNKTVGITLLTKAFNQVIITVFEFGLMQTLIVAEEVLGDSRARNVVGVDRVQEGLGKFLFDDVLGDLDFFSDVADAIGDLGHISGLLLGEDYFQGC